MKLSFKHLIVLYLRLMLAFVVFQHQGFLEARSPLLKASPS